MHIVYVLSREYIKINCSYAFEQSDIEFAISSINNMTEIPIMNNTMRH